ncbi:MAG: dipeptide epimerase [Methanomassiliicoccales archaeon]
MRIDSIDIMKICLKRKEPFRIATGTSKDVINFIILLKSGELTGIGVAVPNLVTGETDDSVLYAIQTICSEVRGLDAEKLEEIHNLMNEVIPRSPAVACGFDLALYDLVAKSEGKEVCDILGRNKMKIETSYTLGIAPLRETIEKARIAVGHGFHILKVKVGLNVEEDIRRIAALREVFGRQVVMRIDANQGYSFEEADKFLQAVEPFDIEFVEQPVKAVELRALEKLASRSSIPIMADESAKSLQDVEKIVAENLASMVNIKLVKFGGVFQSRLVDELCCDHGLKTQVGCMSECQASIAGGLHFSLSGRSVEYADLDSHFFFINDPTEGVKFDRGFLYPSGRPGLGTKLLGI